MAFGLGSRIVLYHMHHAYAAYTWTFARADSLAIGALVALSMRDRADWKTLVKWARILAVPALCAVVVMRVLNPECTTGPGPSPNFAMGTFAITCLGIFFASCLAMAVCLRDGSHMHRVLGSSFLRFFGKYSYCLYICHVPLIVVLVRMGIYSDHLTNRLHSKFLAVVAVNGIAFGASIAVALLSWNLYEKHWLKLRDLSFLRREERPLANLRMRSEVLLEKMSPAAQRITDQENA
jgi:peptidoglycan/LPS O-acetylase OafA/YrhL